MTDERRATPRRRTLKAARIVFNNANSTFDCNVRNLSEAGALLSMDSTLGVPDVFLLIFSVDGVRRDCRVVRRSLKALGVTFTAPPGSA